MQWYAANHNGEKLISPKLLAVYLYSDFKHWFSGGTLETYVTVLHSYKFSVADVVIT